jgi:transposase
MASNRRAYLTDVLERVVCGRTKAEALHALLPWNWTPRATITITSEAA